jgi:DNA-binding MarR family transcriptional regulator
VTGLTTGAITAMIDRLEKAGYVSRERDKEDRRKVFVVPNEAKIYADIAPYTMQMGEATTALSGEFSEAELAAILRFMTRANEIAVRVIGEVRDAE